MSEILKRVDGIGVKPNLVIDIHPAGRRDVVLDRIETHNIVTDNGVIILRDLVGGTGFRPSHLGVGTSATAESQSDTSIGAEVFRQLITRRVNITDGIKLETFIATSEANGNTLVEAGLLETGLQNGDAGDPGVLFARATYTAIAKTASIEITYNWSITFDPI